MLARTLEAVLALLVTMAVYSAVVAAVVEIAVRLLRLRERNLRFGLARILRAARRDHQHAGFDLSACQQDAGRVLAAAREPGASGAELDDAARRPRKWSAWLAPERFGRIAVRTLVDFRDAPELAPELVERLEAQDRPLRRRFRVRLHALCALVAVLLTAGLQLDAMDTLRGASRDFAYVFEALRPGPLGLGALFEPHASTVFGALLSTVLLTLGAGVLARTARGPEAGAQREREEAARAEAVEAPPEPAPRKEEVASIGEDGEVVRAVNFAGGGFDTMMELGVTHALLVIQGRAPDAVVGVSAGAIQAAALAEVLQAGAEDSAAEAAEAGSEPRSDLRSDYQRVLQRRVRRFREFLYAARHAPSRLIDALTPDAYEIDARNPLRPLELPIFQELERRGRQRELAVRTGLVRLYNDLLRIPLSFGTLTRLTRRILGLQAAPEVRAQPRPDGRRSLGRDLAVCAMAFAFEAIRVWLLAGKDLLRSVPLVRMLARPLFYRPVRPRASTAGALIFRFEPLEKGLSGVANGLVFAVLLMVWVSVTWTVLYGPWWLYGRAEAAGIPFAQVILVLYLTPFVALSQPAREWDRADRPRDSARELVKGSAMLGYLLAKWSLLYLTLCLLMVTLAGGVERRLIAVGWLSPSQDGPRVSRQLVAELFHVSNLLALGIGLLVVLGLAVYGISRVRRTRRGVASAGRLKKWYLRRLLAFYNLHDGLASSHPLERFLAGLFDAAYYGKEDIDAVVDDSLKDSTKRTSEEAEDGIRAGRKKIHGYCRPGRSFARPIHVGLAAAEVGSGSIEYVPGEKSVVDGLMAATAVGPAFRPRRIGKRLYVDASHVANAPARALMKMLRCYVNQESQIAYIYSVSPFPMSERAHRDQRGGAGADAGAHRLRLIDIARRALELRRYRDANLERVLTEIYTAAIPSEKIAFDTRARTYFRARVVPVELEDAPRLWKRVLNATEEERHHAISEVIADGCRAALQVMIRAHVDADGISCREAVLNYKASRRIDPSLGDLDLPGSLPCLGPGLREICERCVLSRYSDRERPQHLDRKRDEVATPTWPHELERGPDTDIPRSMPTRRPDRRQVEGRDPRDPFVGLLFSGGVFRGVFQVGVLNAIHELGLRPDIVAGASVGSITAAMVAQALSQGTAAQRKRHIARLGAAYLAVDRLVLTDRFADFVRNATIRAAATGFSLKQADHLFRRYDDAVQGRFGRDARRVVAGIERLFYVNPYQLNALVEAFRDRRTEATDKLEKFVQQWLRRMEVGEEVLGAEPLERLIRYYVVDEAARSHAKDVGFHCFANRGIALRATATNLASGELAILGEGPAEPMLVEGLLTSSAFPGVFRPRWSWDLFPGAHVAEQYVDGGVMDNLPVGALTSYFQQASKGKRPKAPDLIVAASLEPDPDAQRPYEGGSWIDLMRRTKQLGYNGKADVFAQVARDLRNLAAQPGALDSPLDFEMVTVKPIWLCGTFAFHPMLGFRRKRQAQSIAHGCASTLLRFAKTREADRKVWGVSPDAVPEEESFEAAWERWEGGPPGVPGACWLRPQIPCPFSAPALQELDLHPTTRRELSRVHELCPERLTHARGV